MLELKNTLSEILTQQMCTSADQILVKTKVSTSEDKSEEALQDERDRRKNKRNIKCYLKI